MCASELTVNDESPISSAHNFFHVGQCPVLRTFRVHGSKCNGEKERPSMAYGWILTALINKHTDFYRNLLAWLCWWTTCRVAGIRKLTAVSSEAHNMNKRRVLVQCFVHLDSYAVSYSYIVKKHFILLYVNTDRKHSRLEGNAFHR
jgi:hypothetical protein